MEHRTKALSLIEGMEMDLRHGLSSSETATKRLVVELAKIHVLLAIEDRLRELKSRL